MREEPDQRKRRPRLLAGMALTASALALISLFVIGALNRPVLWLAGELSGYRLTCSRIDGSLLRHVTCEGVVMADTQGAFLTARRFDLRWHGLSLLANRVDVDTLILDGARLTRIPKARHPGKGGLLPDIPIAVTRLDLRHFVLHMPSAPGVCASLNGRAMAGPKGFNADLKLVRCAPPRGNLSFAGRYDKTSGALALSAHGADDGALLAALTGIDHVGATTVFLSAGGNVRALDGVLRIAAAGLGGLDATFRAQRTATAFDARALIDPARLPDFAPQGPVNLAARLTYSDPDGFAVPQALLSWGAMQVTAQAAKRTDGVWHVTAHIAHPPVMDPTVALLAGNTLALTVDSFRDGQGALHLDSHVEGRAARLKCVATLGDAMRSGVLTLTLPDLSRLRSGMKGAAVAALTVSHWADDGHFDGTLRMTGDKLGGDVLARALGPLPSLAAQVSGKDGAVTLSAVAVHTAAADLIGSAKRDANSALDVRLKTSRGTLAPLTGQSIQGAFALSAEAHGTFSRPAIMARLSVPRLRAGNEIVRDISLGVNARREAGWRVNLALKGATRAGPADVTALLSSDAQGWGIEIAQGALGMARLAGRIAERDGRYGGNLALSGDVLSPVSMLIGTPLSGQGTIALSGDGHGVRLTAAIAHIHAADLADATLHANADLSPLSGPIDAALQLQDGRNQMSVSATIARAPLTIAATRLSGRWAGAQFALTEPSILSKRDGTYTLSSTRLAVAGGTLTVSGHGGGNAVHVDSQLAAMPLAPLVALIHAGKAEGTLDLTLSADMTAHSTEARLALQARNVAFAHGGREGIPANAELTASWDGARLTAEGSVHGLAAKEAIIAAQIPLVRAPGSFAVRFPQTGAVSAHLSAGIDLSRLMALLPLAEQTASGSLSADLSVSGDIAQPQLSGQIALADASVTDYRSGTRLSQLNATLTAEPDSRATLKLDARDGASGRISGAGEFSLAALETGGVGHLAGHLDLNFDKAELARTDLAQGTFSGKLAIDLPGDQPALIHGTLRTQTVRVDLGAAVPPTIPTIEVHEINGRRVPVEEAAAAPSLSAFARAGLAVDIAIPNRFFIAGRGADTEWSGHLAVRGTLASPDVSGQLDVERGEIALAGKTFTLQDGTVRIDTSLPGHAILDLTAQNESADMTVTVKISGPASAPKIAWSSSPSLPQAEIFSRLFFGAGTPQLNVAQAVELAQMSGALNGLGLGSSGGGVLGFARNLTGLDVLRVSVPSDLKGTGTSVTAGKYIGNRVYVGVTQGTTATAGSAEVQVKIAPHLTVTGTAGANNANSLGIDWKWSY